MLGEDERLLPDAEASSRRLLGEGDAAGRPGLGGERPQEVAREGPPGLPVRRVDRDVPDTAANQKANPQISNAVPGVGLPIAPIGVVSSLACGVVPNMGLCPYAGKGTGEVSLLRRMWDLLKRGDVLLADGLMCNWRNLYDLQQQGPSRRLASLRAQSLRSKSLRAQSRQARKPPPCERAGRSPPPGRCAEASDNGSANMRRRASSVSSGSCRWRSRVHFARR